MDRNEKIWAYSNTGTKAHAFVQSAGEGSKRAVCRASITRSADAMFVRKAMVVGICGACEKKVAAMYDRAEASMQPATESHDLGYVAWEGKFTDAQRDAMQDEFDAAVAAAQAPKVDEADEVGVLDALHAEALEMDAAMTRSIERDPAPEFPAGTRVAMANGQQGTVLAGDRGIVSNIASGKLPQPFVRVKVDSKRGWIGPATLLKFTRDLTRLPAREPQRFHYRAVLATTGGTPLDGIEGYINASDRDAAEAALQERYQTDLIRLTSLHINLA